MINNFLEIVLTTTCISLVIIYYMTLLKLKFKKSYSKFHVVIALAMNMIIYYKTHTYITNDFIYQIYDEIIGITIYSVLITICFIWLCILEGIKIIKKRKNGGKKL